MGIGDTYRLRNNLWAVVVEDKEFTFRAIVSNNPNMKLMEFTKETLNSFEGKEYDAMEMRKEDPYGGL